MTEIHSQIRKEKDTKSKIFMAAAHLFSEKGYNGVSMRELSEHTGLSKPTIYYYFGSKEGIFSALVKAGLHQNMETFQEIMNKNISAKEKIIEIVKIRFNQVLEYPEMAKFFTMLFTNTEVPEFLSEFTEEADRRRNLLVELIKDGIRKKEFGPTANPEIASEIFFGAIIHYITRQIQSDKIILSDKLAEQIVELIFKGLNE